MRVALNTESSLSTQVLDANQQERNRKDMFSRQQPHFVLSRESKIVMACDRKGKQFDPNEISGCPSRVVCDKLLEVETGSVVEVFNEVILRDGSYVRACPNYRNEGPWFDFVNVQWEDEDGKAYLLPAQCLAFYKKNNECLALVQSVDITSNGKVNGHRNTVLVTHYRMQCSRNGVPMMYSINCGSIDSTLLWFNHEPDIRYVDPSRRTIMIVRPRNEWAYAWYVWNQCLRVKNSNRTITKPMVDLGNADIIGKVRLEIEQCVKEHGKT
jgi:hypothetical protein